MQIHTLEDILKFPIGEAMKLISLGLLDYPTSMRYERKNGALVYVSQVPDGSLNVTGMPDNPASKQSVSPYLPQYNEALRAFTVGG